LPNIDTLVQDVQKLFDGHEFNPVNVERMSNQITGDLIKRFSEYGADRAKTLRMSNIGQPFRKLWFQLKSGTPGEALSPETKLKFLYGNLLEELLLMLALEAGHDVVDTQREVEVDGVLGHIDAIIDGVLVDTKSASSFSWNKFNNGGLKYDDPFGYIGQLSGYSAALGGCDAAFFVVDKTLGKLCLDRYSGPDLAEYNVRKRIADAREVLSKDEPPAEYCYEDVPEGKSGNMKLSVGCSYCDHKFNCRPGLRVFNSYRGPIFLTQVAREPRMQEAKD